MIDRLDPSLDKLISPSARVALVYSEPGSAYEGPTWVPGKPGHLDFSVLSGNKILSLNADGKVGTLLDPVTPPPPQAPTPAAPQTPSGAAQPTAAAATGASGRGGRGRGISGSNGTTLDTKGQLVFCLYSGGKIERLTADGKVEVLADNVDGKPLQAPNDVVVRSDGNIYFTEQKSGVYLITPQGKVSLLANGPPGPNGLAFSPDEKSLYTTDDLPRYQGDMGAATGHPRRIMRFEVHPDGTIGNGITFVDMMNDAGWGFVDGLKVDKEGYVWAVGPSGVWILSPQGKHIGTIIAPVARFTNLGFGGDDGKTLYLTSQEGIYKLPLASSRWDFKKPTK
jgi:gluconolactonase